MTIQESKGLLSHVTKQDKEVIIMIFQNIYNYSQTETSHVLYNDVNIT